MSSVFSIIALVIAIVATLLGNSEAFSASSNLRSLRGFLKMAAPPVAQSKVLIIQNKGGGHGEIGFQLCKTLASMYKGVDITILQDEACNYKKLPFSKYEMELKSALGVKVFDTKLTGDGSGPNAASPIKGMKFDYIIDNWAKGTENATFSIGIADESGASQHLFVSSAGMYKNGEGTGATEDSDVKENDARKVELAMEAASIPYTFLRPQYIYGPNAAKRYLDYFIARAARKLPTPVPLDGSQKVSIVNIYLQILKRDGMYHSIAPCPLLY